MKYQNEFSYWQTAFVGEGHTFLNAHYARRMLHLAGEQDDDFLRGKIVADFGCGPRGSLAWTQCPALRIGIDVLASTYIDAFADVMLRHGMVYVTSTERTIPLPDDFVDIMFTLNAMDHVDDFAQMATEVLRVLKPGGTFIGSFNLHEPTTDCEPQTLTEDIIRQNLLHRLHVTSYRAAIKHPQDPYKFLHENKLAKTLAPDEQYVLWVRGDKRP